MAASIWQDGDFTDYQESEQYEYLPRRIVRRGEKLRLRGGPVYVSHDGTKIAWGERGVHTFLRHGRELTARGKLKAEYIVVTNDNGGETVVVLNQKKSRYGLPIKFRPYKISKVRR